MRFVLRTAAIATAIVAAACVQDAPVSPTRSASTSSPSLQLATTAGSSVTLAPGAPGARYLVVFKPGQSGTSLIREELSKTGGRLEGAYDQLGFAVVSGISSDAVARLSTANAISSLEPDVEFAIEPLSRAEQWQAGDVGIQSVAAPQGAAFYAFQWSLRAIAADVAWAH